MTPHTIDLGFQGAAPPGMPPQVHQQALAYGTSWRTLLRCAQDLVRQGQDGRLALQRLRPCVDSQSSSMRMNATLRKDEWKLLDERVQASYQSGLNGVSDLLGRGNRINIANPFGTTVLEGEKLSEMTEANVAMYAGTPPSDDRVEFDLTGVPVPVISKGFWLDERVLESSRMRGQTLDTTNAGAATRVVSEKLENLLFNGGPSFGGYTLYGYTTHPHRNQSSLTGSWLTLASTQPYAIKSDVISMKTTLMNDDRPGPYVLYIPHGWADALDEDYFTTNAASPAVVTGLTQGGRSIREVILGLDRVESIRTTKELTNEVVLVDMSREVVEVGYGFEPRLVQWESQGGMVNHFRIISIMTFVVRSDYSGKSGIAHYSV